MNVKPTTLPLDLSRYRKVPTILMVGGGVLSILGALINLKEFAYTWLVSFMFFLSIGLGGLFLVVVHHLFDAGWSVAIRRVCEHLSTLLFPALAVLFLPIAVLAKVI